MALRLAVGQCLLRRTSAKTAAGSTRLARIFPCGGAAAQRGLAPARNVVGLHTQSAACAAGDITPEAAATALEPLHRAVLAAFPQPMDAVFAYGSGVFAQRNYDASQVTRGGGQLAWPSRAPSVQGYVGLSQARSNISASPVLPCLTNLLANVLFSNPYTSTRHPRAWLTTFLWCPTPPRGTVSICCATHRTTPVGLQLKSAPSPNPSV